MSISPSSFDQPALLVAVKLEMPTDVVFLGLSTSTGGVDAGLFLLPRMGVLARADSIYLHRSPGRNAGLLLLFV